MSMCTGPAHLHSSMHRIIQPRTTIPCCRPSCRRGVRTVVRAGDSIRDTFKDIGKKQFDLTQTSYRKGGMESEKVDGPVSRLWKFFFRPGDGYVDRYGFSVPMGPLDDVRFLSDCHGSPSIVHMFYVAKINCFTTSPYRQRSIHLWICFCRGMPPSCPHDD